MKKRIYHRVTVTFTRKSLKARIPFPYHDWLRSLYKRSVNIKAVYKDDIGKTALFYTSESHTTIAIL